MAQELTDIHAKILAKAAKTKEKKGKVDPEGYTRRIADLDDPEEVKRTILSCARAANDCRLPHELIWKETFRAWHQILDPNKKEDKWRSKRFLPLLFQHVETAYPSIASAVFSGRRIWAVRGQGPDGRDHADAVDDYLDHAARGPSRMKREYFRMLWWSLMCGTGILDHGWNKEVVKRRVAVATEDFDGHGRKIDEDGNPIDSQDTTKVPRKVKTLEERQIVLWDDPFVRALNPFDVWIDPAGRMGDDMEYTFHKHETTLQKVIDAANSDRSHLDKQAVKEWLEATGGTDQLLNFDQNDSWDTGMDLTAYDSIQEEVGYRTNRSIDTSDQPIHGAMRVVLLVMRTKAETFTLAPGGRIIGWSDNPHTHQKTGIVTHHNYEVPDSPWGRGMAGIILPHQELANENINRAMDVDEISLMAPVGVDRTKISTLDDKFRWQPNALVKTRGNPKEAVTRLDMPTPTNLAMAWDQHFKKDAEDTTGMTEQARGNAPTGVNTATEFTGLQANIKTRTFIHVENLNETMEISANLHISNIQQYMTQKKIISVIGEAGQYYREIKPTDVIGEFTVQGLVSASRMAPAMKIQQLIAATQVLVPLIPQIPNNPFLSRWCRMMLTEMEVEDVDRLIPKNQDKMRDPYMENVWLRKGGVVKCSPFDRHDLHMEAHSAEERLVQQLVDEGKADISELTQLHAHMEDHMVTAQQSGANAAQTSPVSAVPGGSPDRQQAQQLGAAQGSNGVPGAASPGPAAPMGRPA